MRCGRTCTPVLGNLTAGEDLNRLLNGTGIGLRWVNGNSVALERAAETTTGDDTIRLDTLQIEGATTVERETGAERDARGYNEVYDLDISSSFAGREEVERYKGVNTADVRSEEHTSELQSLMRISYAVYCLNKKSKVRKEEY